MIPSDGPENRFLDFWRLHLDKGNSFVEITVTKVRYKGYTLADVFFCWL